MMKCKCGEPLPMHLFNIAKPKDHFSHVCTCERKWEKKADGSIVCVGTWHNPFKEKTNE